ncbi:hypothetical protein COT60_03445 [Candidatus Pacearchaeota archaeon CG09_land_8_20_14_0_10_30_9]|nr:hypothetical protein [Candidatus Pacearchaeota archaeon]OIO40025.1 MAG: hypothetical protein AUJ61_02795 [Candidatus Pacearchaeota archaeon CG1_02_30_18]PIN71265.1 MAG: hypothetical protein COV77_02865 [Candidatus Pacearchaeota archaeon CG11_big_fil_rev_8_21_14_0_20_30_13]PIO00874.1 MAG: hypothetical protein COT60_03445 [Candidatus Pacearchaeota archaeon CG09_land_8_20_14_0_10_30_9]PIZ81972.1 MAG: hypothetical protein COX98_01720 [Candidatus Pacearchaeota archaeon CG_4_10_14_0_2_um_filter_30
MEEIIQEKISADHLLYVSLKYTKTCDVIMNLLLRWRKMIDTCIIHILKDAKQKGKVKEVSENAMGRIAEIKGLLKKDQNALNTIDFFMMLRKIESLQIERIGEFRKNVTLKVIFRGKEININLEKLKEYAEMLEKFIGMTKKKLNEK